MLDVHYTIKNTMLQKSTNYIHQNLVNFFTEHDLML